jgi:hypothetical protein
MTRSWGRNIQLWGGKLCPDGKLQPFKGGIDLRFNTMYKASRQPVSSPLAHYAASWHLDYLWCVGRKVGV